MIEYSSAPYTVSLMCNAAVTPGDPHFSLSRFPFPSAVRSIVNKPTQQLLPFKGTKKNEKMSHYTTNNSNNCLNTTNSFNKVWNNCTFADDRSQLLTWLSPLEPSLRHCDIQERRVNDIGEWLTQTEEFGRWCGLGGNGQADKAVLFC